MFQQGASRLMTPLLRKTTTPQEAALAAFNESRLWDLNPGPMLYESIALPLS